MGDGFGVMGIGFRVLGIQKAHNLQPKIVNS